MCFNITCWLPNALTERNILIFKSCQFLLSAAQRKFARSPSCVSMTDLAWVMLLFFLHSRLRVYTFWSNAFPQNWISVWFYIISFNHSKTSLQIICNVLRGLLEKLECSLVKCCVFLESVCKYEPSEGLLCLIKAGCIKCFQIYCSTTDAAHDLITYFSLSLCPLLKLLH